MKKTGFPLNLFPITIEILAMSFVSCKEQRKQIEEYWLDTFCVENAFS